jgi:hypothetical protein
VNADCINVDELVLEIADHTNDYADMPAEKLFRKCSTSWEAYQYYKPACIMPGYGYPTAHAKLRRIIKRIQVQIQRREYGYI